MNDEAKKFEESVLGDIRWNHGDESGLCVCPDYEPHTDQVAKHDVLVGFRGQCALYFPSDPPPLL